jgi:hypothetical protein
MKVIDDCLPRDPEGKQPEKISDRNQLHIESIEWEYFPDLSVWYTDIQELLDKPIAPAGGAQVDANGQPIDPMAQAPTDGSTPPPGAPMQTPPTAPTPPPDPNAPPPDPNAAPVDPNAAGGASPISGPGWVIQIKGHHFHNHEHNNEAAVFVRNTLIKNLKDKVIDLPDGQFTTKELGIDYPLLVNTIHKTTKVPLINENVEVVAPTGPEVPGAFGKAAPAPKALGAADPTKAEPPKQREFIEDQYNFIVHFCWKPTTLNERLLNRKKKADAEAEAKKQQQELAAGANQ